MRLNQHHKDAFVRAVIDDIPKVDYSEEMRKAVQEYALSKLPPEIKKIWRNNELRGFLRTRAGCFYGFWIEFPYWSSCAYTDEKEIKEIESVSSLSLKIENQSESIRAAKNKVVAAISSVSTLKKAKELFPEFSKYLPSESDPVSKFAPAVIANLSADLMALGWPKDSKKDSKKKALKSAREAGL